MEVVVQTRGGKPSKRFPITIKLESTNATVKQLKLQIQSTSKLSFHRQRITTLEKKALDDNEAQLASLGIKSGDKLEIKDLGPQVSWTTVFLTEYAGPLFIHPAFFFLQKLIYRKEFEHSLMQKVAFGLILAHYGKRELETVFVHRFSSATMPILNLFKNSGHYWGLSGLLIAAPLYGPWNSAKALEGTLRSRENFVWGMVGIWAFAQLSNLHTHLTLRSLRPAGTRTRAIPKGYGFNWVSCPNYFFETVAWTAFLGLTWDLGALVFLVVAVIQMYVWAVKKHVRYKKEFGKEYPKRKVMFPLLA
ncbi:hypothetical protein T439DRAFT_376977 [Meredithblackwellia eburnea MCA 4105]